MKKCVWKKTIAWLLALLLLCSVFVTGCADLMKGDFPEGLFDETEEELFPEEETSAFELPEDVTERGPPQETTDDVSSADPKEETTAAPKTGITVDGVYTTKEDVAAYIRAFDHLPSNFITKDEARSHGWQGGGLDSYQDCYGKCIGGDRFGNYEKRLPEAPDRVWTECDIDTLHANSRGIKRIVFSNDGLIYYSDDHYETFTLCN